jgi:hypothetical protein
MTMVSPTEERFHFGSVAALADYRYRKVLIIASPECANLDWRTCLLELGYRFGDLGDIGEPTWAPERVWVWVVDIPNEVSTSADDVKN